MVVTSDSSQHAVLQVGVLLDERGVTRRALEIVRQVKTSTFATVTVVILVPAGGAVPESWLFRLYRWCDRLTANADEDPFAFVDATDDLASVPVLAVPGPADTQSWDTIREKLRSTPLDVMLDLRETPSEHGTREFATYGSWALRDGADSPECVDLGGFWDVKEASPTSAVDLRAQGATGERLIRTLSRSVVARIPSLSWERNRRTLAWASSPLIIQKLQELDSFGWQHVSRKGVIHSSPGDGRSDAQHHRPTNLDMVRWLGPEVLRRGARRLVRRRTRLEWRLAIRRSSRTLLDGRGDDPLAGFRWLTASAGRWYADPFLVADGHRLWLFFEDADAATGLGRLSVAEIGSGEAVGEAAPVLERPHHLSYPCVFRDAGEWFLIPESSATGGVELLRSRRFPFNWTPECVLIRARAVDSTIWIEDGLYWLFTTITEPRSQAAQLWLFTAERLAGPWTAHRDNPISMDVRNARGAGAVFRHSGKLYRPSQDCSVRYGRAFSLNEVTTLTRDRYEEREVVTVEPPTGLLGVHTYAYCGGVEMIDGCAAVRP